MDSSPSLGLRDPSFIAFGRMHGYRASSTDALHARIFDKMPLNAYSILDNAI